MNSGTKRTDQRVRGNVTQHVPTTTLEPSPPSQETNEVETICLLLPPLPPLPSLQDQLTTNTNHRVEVIATEEIIEAVVTETIEATTQEAVDKVEEGTAAIRDRTLAPITNTMTMTNVEIDDPLTNVTMTGHRDTMIKHTMLINPTTSTGMHSLHICNNTTIKGREETLNKVTIIHRIVTPTMLTQRAVTVASIESQMKTVATLMIDQQLTLHISS
jgi:hypothetical protein